jgi:hypothetical protein
LTSIFYPVLTIPKTLTYIFTPLHNFVSAYQKSFTDGSQQRSLDRFTETIQSGGAVNLLKQIGERAERKAKERTEELKAQKDKEAKGTKVPGHAGFVERENHEKSGDQLKEAQAKMNLELESLKARYAKRSTVVKVKSEGEVEDK